MITLTKRPYAGEGDLQAIADFLNACEAVDKLDEWTSVAELRVEFDTPSVDKGRDIRLWEDAKGQLIGFGQVWIPQQGEVIDGWLWFRVHPSTRGGNVEKQIIRWGEERMREVRQERGVPVKLRASARDRQEEQVFVLESCGFTCDRYFFTMERSLKEPIAEPQFPNGFTLGHREGAQDTEAWVQLYNQSFIDHWNHHPLTVENVNHYLTDPDYRPELDLIALAPDGTFAAFCYCHIHTEDNAHSGRNEGWIAILGTRRGFRRIGLGRAILLAGMHQLKAAGMDMAKLGVDAENPNGALQLYESVGFHKIYTRLSFVKDV